MNRRFFPAIFAASACLTALARDAGAQMVTFRVDLSIQESIERYDPATDVVEVRGPFNSWGGGTVMVPLDADPSVYEIELELFDLPGTEIPYKFLIVADGGFGDVLWEGQVGAGEFGNRLFVFEEGGQVLPTVYFDNLSVDPGAGVEVTFQVDMSLPIEDMTFVPALDFLEVRGSFNGWIGGIVLEPLEPGSSVFHATTAIKSAAPGSTVEYKFVFNGASWEEGANRTFVLAQEPTQVLPVRFFSDINPDLVLTADTEVLFTVDMNGAVGTDGIPFDPALDTLYVNGDFIPTGWWATGAPFPEYEMLDDGSPVSGDAVAGDGVYSFIHLALSGDVERVEYKYFINGQDNEAGFQDNHVRFIRQTGTFAFPRDTFGQMVREPESLPTDPGTISISAPSGGMVTVTWDNPDAVLQHSESMAADTWSTVPDSQGKTEMAFQVDDPRSSNFRLSLP
jgi:hypothetical protein